jgi:hypothetical protein
MVGNDSLIEFSHRLKKCRSKRFILCSKLKTVRKIWDYFDQNNKNVDKKRISILSKETSLYQLFQPPHNFVNIEFDMHRLYGNFYIGKKTTMCAISYFKGTVKDNKFDGECSLVYFNSTKTAEYGSYVGSFKDNSSEGFGTYKDGKGTSITGTWMKNNNKYSENILHNKFTGKFEKVFENGDFYSGDFVDGLMQGVGIMIFKKSGWIYEGNWFKRQTTRC